MNRVSTWLIAILAAISLTLGIESVARADDYQCTGTVNQQSLDNIFVPDGQTCTLNGTRAEGDIKVGTGSTLVANAVIVDGNIQAEGSTSVSVSGATRVRGNIQIKQGDAANITDAMVDGDIQFDEMRGQLVADGNTVGGNLQAFKNRGGLTIQNNLIDGNLQCKENNPAPTGSNNQAASLEDQCAALDGPGDPDRPDPDRPDPDRPDPDRPGQPGPDDENCTTSLGAVRFENLFVPDGQICTLNGTRVDGNIKVGTDSTLIASAVIVEGNIQAEGATNVHVSGASRVGGNIQIKQGDAATIVGVHIDADLQFDANSHAIRADNNIVGGNLQAMGNSGGLTLRGNNIDGNLQCKENTPPPTGSNNRAASLEDQCAALSASAIADTFVNQLFLPGIR